MPSSKESSSSGGVVATTVLMMGVVAGNAAAFCPSWFTVRSPFFHEQKARAGNVQAIRQGEIAFTVLSVAEGWAISNLVGSPLPLLGSLVVSAIMVTGYEYSMKHPALEVEQAKIDAARPIYGRTLSG